MYFSITYLTSKKLGTHDSYSERKIVMSYESISECISLVVSVHMSPLCNVRLHGSRSDG